MADKPTEKPDAPAPASDAVAAATDAKQPELASTDEAKLEGKLALMVQDARAAACHFPALLPVLGVALFANCPWRG